MRPAACRRIPNLNASAAWPRKNCTPDPQISRLFAKRTAKLDGREAVREAACTNLRRTVYYFMFGVATSDDYQPVTWMGRYPIHVTTLLVMVHVICMIISCLLIAVGAGGFLNLFTYNSAEVIFSGRIWQILTYAFVHSPSGLIWFAIEMYMLFTLGAKWNASSAGARSFSSTLLLLCVPPLLLTIWGFWQATGLAGSATIHFAIFIAFAAIYPNVELFLRIMAKWVALIFVAAYSLQLLAYHAWSELVFCGSAPVSPTVSSKCVAPVPNSRG